MKEMEDIAASFIVVPVAFGPMTFLQIRFRSAQKEQGSVSIVNTH
jgi:hypothetical protein